MRRRLVSVDIKLPKNVKVSISDIVKHPTMRMDAKYWIKKNAKSNDRRQTKR